MRTLCLLMMALLGTSATAAPVPKELKKQGSIVGRWKLESATIGGVPPTVPSSETYWTIDKNFGLKYHAQTPAIQLKIDPTTNEIDLPSDESSFLGLYKVQGNELTIVCVSGMNLPRPKTFEPNADNYVWVLRRAEK